MTFLNSWYYIYLIPANSVGIGGSYEKAYSFTFGYGDFFNYRVCGAIITRGFIGAAAGGSTSFGILTIPGWIAGAVSGATSSALAAAAADGFAIKVGK
ncbi:hypothetical protein AGMMS50267_02930 [Spirochaetia bacterium]|nr:hypothetical protein AGMMS50267_02930 [Spirochaetia bacterium]